VLVCADPRTMMVYLTTRRAGDREKLFQASVASAVEQMMLVAASMGFGTVWVSVREEIEAELRELFNVPQPIRLLWVVPIGRARFWPGAKPRRKISDFTHYESYEPKKMRDESLIRAWPKG
jgi:nitroreductase